MRKKFIINPLCACFCFLVSLAGHSQEVFSEYLSKDSFMDELEDLRKEFGKNKIIRGEIELECLTALSYYPELKATKITFQFGSPASTMVARPKFKSVLRSGYEREYEIIVKKPGTSGNGLDWTELSFNSLVGWIAHELGHITHYTHKTSAGILFTGIKYAFPKYRRRMERFTDNIVIHHDLGYALLEGTDYTINYSTVSSRYKNYLKKYYLSPPEIKEKIETRSLYKIIYRKLKVVKLDAITKI